MRGNQDGYRLGLAAHLAIAYGALRIQVSEARKLSRYPDDNGREQ